MAVTVHYHTALSRCSNYTIRGEVIISNMSNDTAMNDIVAAGPAPDEAEKMVKRMSAGNSLVDPTTGQPLPKDDKVLKIATFSLQKYLKASIKQE